MTKTIQVHEDVYKKLEEMKKDRQESFNDVLRQLLNIDKMPQPEPVSYRGEIIMQNVGIQDPDINDIISQFNGYINQIGQYIPHPITIRGIPNVGAIIRTHIILAIIANTEQEVREAFNRILEGRNQKEVETTIRRLIYSN